MVRKILISLFILILLQNNCFGETVIKVLDGDTVLLSNNQKIRLFGYNSPECTHKIEPYGCESKNFLKEKLENKEVIVIRSWFNIYSKKMQHSYKSYDRIVAKLYVCNKVDVGKLVVSNGYGRDFTKYSHGLYLEDENQARLNKLGMWKDSKYCPDLNNNNYPIVKKCSGI